MVDFWQILNPDTKRYTWRRKNPNIQCRLDFFLINCSLCTDILEADILPGYKSDHSLITLTNNTHVNPRGPGFWKLNTSSLSEREYVELIKNTMYNVSNITKTKMKIDETLLWEVINVEVGIRLSGKVRGIFLFCPRYRD